MSKTTLEAEEIFTVCKQNVDKYFSEIERALPQYLQPSRMPKCSMIMQKYLWN